MTTLAITRRRAFARTRRVAGALLAGAAVALVVPALVFAHATVLPKTSAPGARERYVLRVPNEKDVPTTRVEIHFPSDLRVGAFGDVAGWQLEVLTDSAKRITGAVWTGSLAPQRFVEFPFVATNPKSGTALVWPTYQTYADGEKVEWTGGEGSKTPASSTSLAASVPTGATGTSGAVSWAALAIAVISLGLALRRKESAPGR